ncbi:MAG: ATP-binding protein [Treponema sp.]|nr:ATP-binding protein [Treponema sp.]
MRKIKQIEIKKLFGYEKNNYTVNLLEDSPLTFIYAFNGIGKTTLFRLIDAAIKRKMTVLDSIIFESLKITFDTNETLTVKKIFLRHFDDITMGELPKDGNNYYFPIVYEWHSPGEEVIVGKHYFEKKRSEEINLLLEEDFDAYSKMPYSRKTDKGIRKIPLNMFYRSPIVDESIGKEIEDNLANIGVDILYANKDYSRLPVKAEDARFDYKISIFENYKSNDIIPLEINEVSDLIQKRKNEIDMMSDISWKEFSSISFDTKEYDRNLHFLYLELDDKIQYMQTKMSEYLKELSSLRNIHDYSNIDEKLLKKIFDKTTNPIDVKFGLLEHPEKLNELIVEYAKKQINKIMLFEKVINEKACLTDKNIFINRETGEIEMKLDFEEGSTIPPENLSSGEKNVLLLYFHLIFLVPDKRPENFPYIALIDEPEVSMHPDWLITFIESLKFINAELGRRDNIQFIVATHSPAITYANSHLMVPMKRS